MNSITMTHPDILRKAAYHQTNNGLIWLPPAMNIQSQGNAFASPNAVYNHRAGIRIVRYRLTNNAADGVNVGLGLRFENRVWWAGRLSADGATLTDITSSAQTSTTAVAVQATGADQTGFTVYSVYPFDWVSAYFTTAETNAGGSSVVDHTVTYSQGASWSSAYSAAFTDNFTTANTVWGTGVKNFVWARPSDWTPTAANGGMPDGVYALRFTSAEREGSDVAAQVTGIEIGVMPVLGAGLDDTHVFAAEAENIYHPAGDAVVAYFSTADAANHVYVECDTYL